MVVQPLKGERPLARGNPGMMRTTLTGMFEETAAHFAQHPALLHKPGVPRQLELDS